MNKFSMILSEVLLNLITANYWCVIPQNAIVAIHPLKNLEAKPGYVNTYMVTLHTNELTMLNMIQHARNMTENHSRLALTIKMENTASELNRSRLRIHATYFQELADAMQSSIDSVHKNSLD